MKSLSTYLALSALSLIPTNAAPAAETSIFRRAGRVQYAGINIAGFEFGCDIWGHCIKGNVNPILSSNAAGQMNHFVQDDGLNIFRLTTSWQFMTNFNYKGPIDPNALSQYDSLVKACVDSGAQKCVIDLHNYARWGYRIIGENGGPSAKDFARFWGELAGHYATNDKVIFGLMNEPHGVNITTWAKTCQGAVNAIRAAGAKTQLITLAGNHFDAAGTFLTDGSAAALIKVKDTDGTTDKLIFEGHQYYDTDNSGGGVECVKDNAEGFTKLAAWLRQHKRKGLISETGASNSASCQKYYCNAIRTFNANSDVYLGFVSWGAGGFDTTYVDSNTPTFENGKWTDQPIVQQCVVGAWKS